MTIRDRVGYFELMHVFKIRQSLAPSYSTERFTRVEQRHSYNTRGSGRNFSVSDEICGSLVSFSYTAVKLWNQLPSELIKEIKTLTVFKKKLRVHFSQILMFGFICFILISVIAENVFQCFSFNEAFYSFINIPDPDGNMSLFSTTFLAILRYGLCCVLCTHVL